MKIGFTRSQREPINSTAHARACSIIGKSNVSPSLSGEPLDGAERSLVRKLSEYTDVMNEATKELLPHLVCTYLFDLAQTFNRFYESSRIIGDVREAHRLALVIRYRDTLAHGLGSLGIAAPEKL